MNIQSMEQHSADLQSAIANFRAAMKEAKEVTAWALKELEDLNRAPSLAVSSERDTTKDGGARLSQISGGQ